MGTVDAHGLLDQAWQAAHSGDFDAAQSAFEGSLALEPLPDAQNGLAYLHMAGDNYDDARRLFELAYRGYRDAGELQKAAKAAISLASVHWDGFGNESAANGWLERAGRLVDQVGRCVERGYLALALVACHARDINQLEQSAAVALELAIEFKDADLEAKALSDGGLALITQGRIKEGFARLDEAMAAVSAGEVSSLFSGVIYCALLTACERTGDVRRAEEWTASAYTYLADTVPGKWPVLHSHCRTAYGVVLCDTGRWSEGETEILHGFGPPTTVALSKQAESVAALAGLRLLQGRVEDAAELLAPFADRFEVCEQMARLHLMRGEHELAAAVIVRRLEELVGDRLRGGRMLALLVQAELGRDNIQGAARALERLEAYADASESITMRATAKLSEARLERHRERWAEAIELLTDAAKLMEGNERPLLAGRIMFELSGALAHAGQTATAVAEARSALAIFERLGAERDADEVAALLRTLGVSGRTRREAPESLLTARELEVFALLGEGLTNAEIAERLFITPKTAEHHVGRVLNKLGVRSRTEAAALAVAGSN